VRLKGFEGVVAGLVMSGGAVGRRLDRGWQAEPKERSDHGQTRGGSPVGSRVTRGTLRQPLFYR
jgi:hypothetical protein